MSAIRSNISPNDIPALTGMLARKFGPVVIFSEEEINAQPEYMTITLTQTEDGKGLILTLVDGEVDE